MNETRIEKQPRAWDIYSITASPEHTVLFIPIWILSPLWAASWRTKFSLPAPPPPPKLGLPSLLEPLVLPASWPPAFRFQYLAVCNGFWDLWESPAAAPASGTSRENSERKNSEDKSFFIFYLASEPAGQVCASSPVKLLSLKQAAEQSGRAGK